MLRILFFLFIAVPLLELYVLIEVGSDLGGFTTIALCLLTAAIGGILIRIQGIMTLLDARKRMAAGEIPANHGLHGLMLAAAGLFLFLPGFITDTLGFMLLVPAIRQFIISKVLPIQSMHQGETIIEAEIIHDKHLP